jgi:hypothetical protein
MWSEKVGQHTSFDFDDISDLELDLLLLYYTYSDQHGRVDTLSAANFAAARFGVLIPRVPFKLDQRHVDVLMDRGLLPDVRVIFNKIALLPAPSPKKRRRKRDDSNP